MSSIRKRDLSSATNAAIVQKPVAHAPNEEAGENWGPFKFLRAQKVIIGHVRGNAQHCALVLAAQTGPGGTIEMTNQRLAELTGRSKDTIPLAVDICIDAGLLHRRRIRDGYRYTWLKVAYGLTSEPEVGQRAKNAYSTSDVDLLDAVRRVLRPCYFTLLADTKRGYGIKQDDPDSKALALLTVADEEQILARLAYHAKWLCDTGFSNGQPHIEAVNQGLEAWFAQPGAKRPGDSKGFLQRRMHALRFFAVDSGDLLRALRVQKLNEAKRKASEATQTTAIYDPKKQAMGAKDVLASLNAPKQPAARTSGRAA